MRLAATATLCVILLRAEAAPFSPPVFTPMTHPDGTQTWSLKIALGDIPESDRDAVDRDTKVASTFLAHHKFCEKGWQLTKSTTSGKWLMLEGRCTSA